MSDNSETYFVTDLLSQIERIPADAKGAARASLILKVALKDSVKFRLPDNGEILPAGTMSYGDNLGLQFLKFCPEQRLPFPSIAIECRSSAGPSDACVILAWQESREDTIKVVRFDRDRSAGGFWSLLTVSAEWKPSSQEIEFIALTARSAEGMKNIEERASMADGALGAVSAVLSLMIALSCSNCSYEQRPHGRERLNRKRLKQSKPPFYSYKVLTITESGSGRLPSSASNSRSPRVHLRRGHIRRLADKTVWVNASVVGDKSMGFVSKDYAVSKIAGGCEND